MLHTDSRRLTVDLHLPMAQLASHVIIQTVNRAIRHQAKTTQEQEVRITSPLPVEVAQAVQQYFTSAGFQWEQTSAAPPSYCVRW